MGLHNKFPPYFYKRGNLFNTYLRAGGTGPLSKKKRPRRRPASPPKIDAASPTSSPQAERSTPVGEAFRPTPAAEKLVAFSRRHLTADEACRLLHLISADHGQALRADTSNVWEQLAYFASTCLSQARVSRYQRALEHRLEVGAPLIQRSAPV